MYGSAAPGDVVERSLIRASVIDLIGRASPHGRHEASDYGHDEQADQDQQHPFLRCQRLALGFLGRRLFRGGFFGRRLFRGWFLRRWFLRGWFLRRWFLWGGFFGRGFQTRKR